jgi:predicted aspartyl protease
VADIVADGKTRVAWVPAIANIAAPTTTELNAGLLLQSLLTADGLGGFQPETAKVDTSSLASTFNTARNGRTSFASPMLTLKRQDTGDTAYTTLIRGAAGYIVIRSSVTESTAWTSTQVVRVYPVECGEVQHVDLEENALERYQVPLTVTLSPNLRAAVA